MRRYVSTKTTKNSLLSWYRFKNPLSVAFNFLILSLVKILPSISLRRLLLKVVGVRIGKDVSVGLGAQFDIFFPELIEIGDNTIIGYNATLLTHEFLTNEFRKGELKIGRDVVIGANATVLCGIEIGDGAVVGAGSVVTKDVPKGAFVIGVPARVMR